MKTKYKQELFNKMPVIGVMINVSLEVIETILPYYKKAGFTTLEITMNSKNAIQIIKKLSENNPDMNFGAGTVCTINDLKTALNSGASFIVSPILDLQVMSYCKVRDIPIFPGAFTPLEVYNAYKLGATAVKIFPATQLGPTYIKDILNPLNYLKLLPTGGVSVDNVELFFKAGAIGVGMGSSLFDKQMILNKDYEKLYQHFKIIARKVKNSK